MDTAIVILVLLIVLGLFAGVGYLFLRETGVDQARLWLTARGQAGRSIGMFRSERAQAASTAPTESLDSGEGTATVPLPLTDRPMPLQMDDAALRDLREELQGELRRASGITREFDARLTRIEASAVDTPRISGELERVIQEHAEAQSSELERVRGDITAVRQTAGPRGERRSVALADLYGQLARVESALAGVVNPMLLPGEPLAIPAELHSETLIWDNWSEIGERAYAFGDVFNQNRLVLDPATADEIERFIAILRQGLTGSIYPNIQAQKQSAAQLAQVRTGLESIVAALPGVRRRIELAYRGEPAGDA